MPIGGGSFADVFYAEYKGQVIALKRLRVYQSNWNWREDMEACSVYLSVSRDGLILRNRPFVVKPSFGLNYVIPLYNPCWGLTASHLKEDIVWFLPS